MAEDPYAAYQNDPYEAYQDEQSKPPPSLWERTKAFAGDVATDIGEVGKGFMKGAGELVEGSLKGEGAFDKPVGPNPFRPGSKEYQRYNDLTDAFKTTKQGMGKLHSAVQAHGPLQTTGKIGEAVAETALMPQFGGAGKMVAGSRLLSRAPGLVRTGAEIGTKAGLQGFVQGTTHSGSVTEGAKQGVVASAAAPLITGLTTPAGKLLRKTGQKLYERFLIPGGGPNYNKAVAQNGAEELIKQGEFALTKGGFTRKIEQKWMDASAALKQAEDEALEKMGYAPTGEQTWHVHMDTASEEMPTITLYPEPGPPGTDIAHWKPPSKEVTPYTNIAKRETAVGQHLGDAEKTGPNMGNRTRIRTEKVNETRQGLVDMRPVIQQLREAQSQGTIQGDTILGYKGVNKARAKLMRQIYAWSTPNLHMNARDVIKLRRALDQMLNWERAPGAAPLKPGVQKAVEDGANFVRDAINKQVPGMSEANATYSFYTGINKVLKDKANQTVGHRAMGLIGKGAVVATGLTGYLHSGAPEAIGLAMFAGAVETGINSGANLTGSAIVADRVGRLLQQGKVQQALARLATVGAGAVRNDQPADANAPK